MKIRTGIWALSVCLSRMYDMKSANEHLSFDLLWNWAKEDLRIANLCHNGVKLDENIFDNAALLP